MAKQRMEIMVQPTAVNDLWILISCIQLKTVTEILWGKPMLCDAAENAITKQEKGHKTANSWCFQIQLWSTAEVKGDFQNLASLSHSCLNCPESDDLFFTSHFLLEAKLSLYLLNHSNYSVVQA